RRPRILGALDHHRPAVVQADFGDRAGERARATHRTAGDPGGGRSRPARARPARALPVRALPVRARPVRSLSVRGLPVRS
ncbi:hypothetical protein JYK17_04030, partial [Streptomyces sp. KC 17012]|uniref:hypothetical protein n=1 Tax=Streptomyces plumbidurans TaxID=2814589 RepID=UPI001C9E15C0